MDREFDCILFGATGFTGKWVTKEMKSNWTSKSWAVAGRNEQKLHTLTKELGVNVPIVVADVSDRSSLEKMCKRTRVIISVVGPYRFHGEPVVAAAVSTGTNYVDICGEPEFLERIQLKYNDIALRNGCTVIGACGFDSIPADLGCRFALSLLPTDTTPHSMETFLSVQGGPAGFGVHCTTFEAAVHGMTSQSDLRSVREALRPSRPALRFTGPKPPAKPTMFSDSRLPGQTCLPFPGSDASVIKRTQELMASKFPGYNAYYLGCYCMIAASFWTKMRMIFYGSLFKLFCLTEFGRNFMISHPELFTGGLFSKKGPSAEQIAQAKFSIDFIAHAYSSGSSREKAPDVTLRARVTGPEPGYVACASMVVAAAQTLVDEPTASIPKGVVTAGYALYSDVYLEKLAKRNIRFRAVSD